MKTKNEVNNYEPNVVSDVTPNEKKKLNKKHKIIIAVCSVILAMLLIIGTWFIVERNANKWDVKEATVTIEYGEVYEPSIEDLIDVSKYSSVTSNNTTIKVNATYEVDLNNDNKPMAYYAVGDYNISVSHNMEYKLFGITLFSSDDTKEIVLSVRDTVAPVFDENSPNEIEVYKDCEIENIEETFKATDLAPVTISIDKESINFTKVGEYTTNVYAMDKYDNVINKEIKVKVVEPSITLDKTSLNMTVGDTITIVATVKGKSQDVEWSSSDDSVAKVENGKVTGNKAGTVKITAKANGIEATCGITVKAKASISNSNKRNNNTSSSSNNGSSSKPSSNGGSNSNNGGSSSSNGGSSSGSPNTTVHNHSGDTGNCGKWFNSYSELNNYYLQWAIKQGGNYSGYFNAWQCSCGQWTADFISY